jgi:hypothetical protein
MKKYKSKIAAAVHEAMQDAQDAGVIDKRTMRQFDESCLTPAELLSAREIQRLRKREGVRARWDSLMMRYSRSDETGSPLPTYHSIRAGRAVDVIGRADPNRSTFANHVLRSRCAGREYDATSPRSTRFSVGPGSSWDA